MFDVFLSYSRDDQFELEGLAQALRDAGLRPFLDCWHLAAGQPWQDILAQKLGSSKSSAICLGPGEMGSWQKREMQVALNRQAGAEGFPVIPVLLRGRTIRRWGFWASTGTFP